VVDNIEILNNAVKFDEEFFNSVKISLDQLDTYE